MVFDLQIWDTSYATFLTVTYYCMICDPDPVLCLHIAWNGSNWPTA
jgi:hypothetical protein